MLKGKLCSIRYFNENDLQHYLEMVCRVDNRGDQFPHRVKSPVNIRKEFMENGFSKDDYERLLIVGKNNIVEGEIVHFTIRTPHTREIGYWLFDENSRGQGYVSESVQLLSDYLFRSRPINRLEIIASIENKGSKRVAEKAGFRYEGTLRQYLFMGGKYHDSCVCSLLRDDWTY